MSAPNVVQVGTITGKAAVQSVGNSATAIVTCPSNKVLKVNALYVSNVDNSAGKDITVDFYRSSTAYHIAKAITVPANATLDVISKSIYLEEADSLRLTSTAAGDIQAVCSYEEISQ